MEWCQVVSLPHGHQPCVCDSSCCLATKLWAWDRMMSDGVTSTWPLWSLVLVYLLATKAEQQTWMSVDRPAHSYGHQWKQRHSVRWQWLTVPRPVSSNSVCRLGTCKHQVHVSQVLSQANGWQLRKWICVCVDANSNKTSGLAFLF